MKEKNSPLAFQTKEEELKESFTEDNLVRDVGFIKRSIQLGTIVSGFGNELTDILYFYTIDFPMNGYLRYTYMLFLFLRPMLILLMWPFILFMLKSITVSERMLFPLTVYFNINKWLRGYELVNLVATFLDVIIYQSPVLMIQFYNTNRLGGWSPTEVISLIFTLISIFMDTLAFIGEVMAYRRHQ